MGGGDWVTLEDLERAVLSQQLGAEVSRLSSSASSECGDEGEGRAKEQLLNPAQYSAAVAAVAAQNGYDSPTLLRHKSQPGPGTPPRAASHAIWEPKHCAPTFAAVRRPRGEQSPSNPFAIRFPMVTNHVNALEYTHVAALRQSDHRPVRARFEVKVVALDPSTVSEIIESVRQVIGE